jgi:hypothetical protein
MPAFVSGGPLAMLQPPRGSNPPSIYELPKPTRNAVSTSVAARSVVGSVSQPCQTIIAPVPGALFRAGAGLLLQTTGEPHKSVSQGPELIRAAWIVAELGRYSPEGFGDTEKLGLLMGWWQRPPRR